MRKLVCCLALIAGCQPGPEGPPGPPGPAGMQGMDGTNGNSASRDGSRIKQRFLIGEDGIRFSAGYWDDRLKTACSWVHAVDGQLRCLPVDELPYGARMYADSRCKEQILSGPKDAARYVRYLDATTYHIYELAAFQPSLIYVGESCRTEVPREGTGYYRITELPPTDLISARYE